MAVGGRESVLSLLAPPSPTPRTNRILGMPRPVRMHEELEHEKGGAHRHHFVQRVQPLQQLAQLRSRTLVLPQLEEQHRLVVLPDPHVRPILVLRPCGAAMGAG